jgi:hypothetical protein
MQAKRSVTRGARLALIAAAALSLVGCDVVVSSMNASGKAQDEWTRTYPITPDGRLELVNRNGAIDVVATGGQQIEIRAERIARANSNDAAKELLQRVQIKEEVGASLVRLETVLPSGGGFGHRAEVRYHVRVPASISVRVRNTNGQVRVEGLAGDVRAETTNGGVRGKDLTGAIEASTTNGGVELTVDALAPGGIRAETVNGGVELLVPDDIKAEIRAACVHGGIRVKGLTIDGENSRNRVEGKVNGGGPRISLETTNGGIALSAGSKVGK